MRRSDTERNSRRLMARHNIITLLAVGTDYRSTSQALLCPPNRNGNRNFPPGTGVLVRSPSPATPTTAGKDPMNGIILPSPKRKPKSKFFRLSLVVVVTRGVPATNPWVTVSQLPLHHSRGYTVCKQSTGCTVSHGMEPATRARRLQ